MVCAVSAVDLAELPLGKCLTYFGVTVFVNPKFCGIGSCLGHDALCRKGGILVFRDGRSNADTPLCLNACAAIRKSLRGSKIHILPCIKVGAP